MWRGPLRIRAPVQGLTLLQALAATAVEAFGANTAAALRELLRQCRSPNTQRRLRRVLLRELLLIRRHRDHLPVRCAPGEWVLHDSPMVRIRLVTLEASTRSTKVTEAGSFVLMPLSPVSAEDRYRSFETEAGVTNDVFDARHQLREIVDAEMAQGCVHLARPGVEASHDWRPRSAVLCLRIDGPRSRGFVWSFDAQTLKAQMMYPARVNAARERLMLDFLLTTRHPGAEAFAERLRRSDEYFLRWAGTQVCNTLAPARIEELLGASAQDPHPLIAATAQRLQAALVGSGEQA